MFLNNILLIFVQVIPIYFNISRYFNTYLCNIIGIWKHMVPIFTTLPITFLHIYVYHINIYIWGSCDNPESAKWILLTLHSKLTPGGAQGKVWYAGNQTWVGHR